MCRFDKSIEKLESIRINPKDRVCSETKAHLPQLLAKLESEIKQVSRKEADKS